MVKIEIKKKKIKSTREIFFLKISTLSIEIYLTHI